MANTNKETLNATVHRKPVVKVVAIGEEGLAAVELMMTEGVEGVRFVFYNHSHVTDESITADLLGAHLVIIMGVFDPELFSQVGRVSKGINLLTIGTGVTRSESYDVDAGLFDSLFLVPQDKLVKAQQWGSDFTKTSNFLNLACAGLARAPLETGHLAYDFRDFADVFTRKGPVAIGVGVSRGSDRAIDAVNAALTHPALDGVNVTVAAATLLILKANIDIPQKEIRAALDRLQGLISHDTSCMYLILKDDSFGDEIRATLILSGHPEGIHHPIWDAIQTKNTRLVCQAVFKGIDFDMKNRWGQTLRTVLKESKIWHSRLLTDETSYIGDEKQKIPLLFYKQLASSDLSGDALLCEALLRRGFLAFHDQDGVWLGSGSHPDDLIVLEMVVGLHVTRLSGRAERVARIEFAVLEVEQLRVVECILSIPQNWGMMGGPAYQKTFKGCSWLSYRNTVWGTKLSVCPSTYLREHDDLGYDALDAGIALLVKAWPLARVSTAFCGSCDGHGRSEPHIQFATPWDEAWASAVFVTIGLETPESRWFEKGSDYIKTKDGRFDDASVLAMMEDIQRFARRLMNAKTIEKIGQARAATLNVFGAKEPYIVTFASEATKQLALVAF
jgi:cell division GTPase FtsZ